MLNIYCDVCTVWDRVTCSWGVHLTMVHLGLHLGVLKFSLKIWQSHCKSLSNPLTDCCCALASLVSSTHLSGNRNKQLLVGLFLNLIYMHHSHRSRDKVKKTTQLTLIFIFWYLYLYFITNIKEIQQGESARGRGRLKTRVKRLETGWRRLPITPSCLPFKRMRIMTNCNPNGRSHWRFLNCSMKS